MVAAINGKARCFVKSKRTSRMVEFRLMTRQAAAAVQLALPGGSLSSTASLLGFMGGAIFWTLYVRLLMPKAGVSLYLTYTGFGALSGLMVVALHRLIWHFLRKQVYLVMLSQWTEKSRRLTEVARRLLTEGDAATDKSAEQMNDLAVVDFLQRNFAAAADGFAKTRAQFKSPEATANLIVALAETGHWDQVNAVLAESAGAGMQLDDCNLARLCVEAPNAESSDGLWKIAADQHHRRLLNNLGVRALRVSKFDRAEEAFTLAAKGDAPYGAAHTNLGVLAFRLGDLPRALMETEAAAAILGTNNEIVFNNVGVFFSLSGDIENARRALLQAQKLQPRNTGIQVNLGNCWAAENRLEEAIKSLHACLSWGGYAAEAHYNISLAYVRQKNLGAALEHLSQARQANSSDPDILNNLGWVLFNQGNFDAAYKCFHQAADVNPSPVYLRNFLRAQLAAGKLSEANALLRQVGAGTEGMEFERGVAHLLLATSPDAMNDRDHEATIEYNLSTATAEFRKVVNSGQGPVLEAQLNLGLSQFYKGEFHGAGQAFASILKRTDEHPEMNYLTGMCFILEAVTLQEKSGFEDEATAKQTRELLYRARLNLQKAIEVPRLAETAYYDLAVLHYKLGEYKEAVEMCRHVATANAGRQVLNTLGIIQARMAQELQLFLGKHTGIVEMRKRQIRTEIRALLTAAIGEFRKALEFDPYASLTHANLGLALMIRNESGDLEQALDHWQAMNLHGDPEANKTYQALMQTMSAESASTLHFQDVELSFQALDVRDWVCLLPPVLLGHKYIVQELADVCEWRLQAVHPLVKRALAYRTQIDRISAKVQKLAI
jgi:tetratricopeptide (TPR) repeat protein